MSLLSGNTLRRWTSRLLARDAVFRAVQRGLHSSVDARRAFDRNADRVWSLLDVPSRREIDQLQADLEELDEALSAIQRRVQRLQTAAAKTTDV